MNTNINTPIKKVSRLNKFSSVDTANLYSGAPLLTDINEVLPQNPKKSNNVLGNSFMLRNPILNPVFDTHYNKYVEKERRLIMK